jgi:hypothetical protein
MAESKATASRADRLLREEREAELPPGIDAARARVAARLGVALAIQGGAAETTPRWPRMASAAAGVALFAAGFVVGRSSAPQSPGLSVVSVSPSASTIPALTVSVAPEASATVVEVPSAVPTPRARGVPSVAPVAAPPSSSASVANTEDALLATERALLDRARVALKAGRANDALEAIAEHRALFATGGGAPRLAEERDAFEIHALARAGRIDEAKAAAARFRERYPASFFRPPAFD